MNKQKCPLCEAEDVGTIFSGINADHPDQNKIPIRKCHQCRIVYSDSLTDGDRTSDQPNDDLYAESYYGEKVSNRRLNQVFTKLFQKERQWQALGGIHEGSLLDIGCGDGTFLEHLGASWKKYGYEPSSTGRKALSMKTNIHVYDFENDNTENHRNPFDVVTLWQAFEHVPTPDDMIENIKPALKETGLLFVSVPNFDSLQAKLFKSKWFHLDPARHQFHYTLPTISKIFQDHGLEIQSSNTLSLEYGVFGWWQSLLNVMNFDFNMAYKILKGRKKYPSNAKTFTLIVIQCFLSLVLIPAAGVLTVIEALFNRGAVLNIKLQKIGAS